MINWRFLWFVISEAILVSQYLVLYATFLYAYFSKGKIAEIAINNFGEADFEFWLLPICLIFSTLGIWQYFKK